MNLSAMPLPIPIIAAAAVALVMGVLLFLLVSLKIELWRFKKTVRDDKDALNRGWEAMEARVLEMESIVRGAEARAAVLVPPPTSRSGLNLNKRIQAARMSKHGERPEQIAAALGLPANEIKLLLKVQRLTLPN